MSDVHRVAHAVFCMLAHAGRFRGGTGGPHGVVERFGWDHGTLDAVCLESLFNTAHDFGLGVLAACFGWNHVCVVRGPITDAGFGIVSDDLVEAYRLPRCRIDERLT